MKKFSTLTIAAIILVNLFAFNASAQEAVCIMYAADGRTKDVPVKDIAKWKDVGWYESAFEAQIGFSFDDKLYNDITYTLLKEAEKDESTATKFCLGLVNDDDIPDVLFSSRGGVGIFILKNRKLNLIKNDISDITDLYEDNKFGQYGHIEYIPKKNRIYANYGGSVFMPTFIDIEDDKTTTVCGLSVWRNLYSSGGEEISQLEYSDLFDAYYNDGVEYVEVDYNNMKEISVDNVKTAFIEALSSNCSDKVKMYAPDGRTEDVPINDVAAWKNVGWYDYPVRTMYAIDGRSAVVASKDLLAWINVGWHTRDGILMFSPDGKVEDVRFLDIEAWKKVGWYEYPVVMMYAADGRSAVVPFKDQYDWEEVGWYTEGGTIAMHSSNGRIEDVPVKDVAAWKKVGWFLNAQKSESTLKREAWNFALKVISNRLYVPGSEQFPSFNSNNVVREKNNFNVYVEYTALNRFGVRVRGYKLITLQLSSTGYILYSLEDLLE